MSVSALRKFSVGLIIFCIISGAFDLCAGAYIWAGFQFLLAYVNYRNYKNLPQE